MATKQVAISKVICHECGRVCKEVYDVRFDFTRLPRHKDQDKFWCFGGGQPVEIVSSQSKRVGVFVRF